MKPLIPLLLLMMALVACGAAPTGDREDFSLDLSPSSLHLAPGDVGTTIVNVRRSGAFTGSVNLSLEGDIVGSGDDLINGSFSSNPVVNASSLRLNAGSGVTAGDYEVTVVGTGGGLSRSASLALTVTEADEESGNFTLSISPQALTLSPGGSDAVTVTVSRTGGFAGAIEVGLYNPPAGISATPLAIGAEETEGTLTVTAGETVQPGSYEITLQATSGDLVRTEMLTVIVEAEESVTPPQGVWEARAESGFDRQEVSYVEVGGKFYLAGGSTRQEVYDPQTDSWQDVAPLPTWLDHIQGVAVDGLIYYVGGLSNWPGPHASTVYIYDPVADSFSQGTSMPRGRGGGGVAVYNDRIYYAGGLHNGNVVAFFDVYDPATDSWEQLSDMPHARDHFHAAVVDNKFYAIGGRKRDIDDTIAQVDVYDFATNTWQTLDTTLPSERGGFATAVVGREIFIIGGEGGGRTFDTVEAYDTLTGGWRSLTPMPTARHGIQAVVYEGGIYIAAGGVVQGHGPSNVHEVMVLER